MVVVSGGWIKSVVYPNSGDVIATSKMAAKAVLICRPNSHPFQVVSLVELLREFSIMCYFSSNRIFITNEFKLHQ
jgi:hypothetical protein